MFERGIEPQLGCGLDAMMLFDVETQDDCRAIVRLSGISRG
jgi:hypothetical protein